MGRRSESSRQLLVLGLSGVSEGSLFSSEAVVVELAVAGIAASGGMSLVGGACMGAGWRRGSPCIGDQLHLVTVDKLLVGWVKGRLGRTETLCC